MKEIKAIIQPFMLEHVCDGLDEIEGLPGITVSQVTGWGKTRAAEVEDSVEEGGHAFARKTKIEIVIPNELADLVVDTIARTAHTGNVGDGKIFVYDVEDVVQIRTGERGEKAI